MGYQSLSSSGRPASLLLGRAVSTNIVMLLKDFARSRLTSPQNAFEQMIGGSETSNEGV
jgi:hypothetical protein